MTDAEITVMTIVLLKAALTDRNIPFQNHGRSKLHYVDLFKICEAERRLGALREAARLGLVQAEEIANRLLVERAVIEAENVERLRRDQVARDAAALLRAHHHIGDRLVLALGSLVLALGNKLYSTVMGDFFQEDSFGPDSPFHVFENRGLGVNIVQLPFAQTSCLFCAGY